MLYLDANVFIIAVRSADEQGEKARGILRNSASGKELCITSVLSWDEVFWSVKRHLGREKAIEQAGWILDLPGVSLVSANSQIIELAHSLVKKYNINPRDAIHASTAIENKCKAIVSSDQDFEKIKEIKWIKV